VQAYLPAKHGQLQWVQTTSLASQQLPHLVGDVCAEASQEVQDGDDVAPVGSQRAPQPLNLQRQLVTMPASSSSSSTTTSCSKEEAVPRSVLDMHTRPCACLAPQPLNLKRQLVTMSASSSSAVAGLECSLHGS
jgi:hypothetical protein